jgi:hypothetical protein
MGAAFNQLGSIDAVACNLFISERDAEFHEAWLVLLVLAKWGIPRRRETAVQVGAGEIKMEKLLRSLNVYIARGEKEGEFRVRIMRFIEKYLHLKFGSNFRVPLFFGDSAAAKARDVLEWLLEHRIILQFCLGADSQTLKDLAHPLQDESGFAAKSCALIGQP